MLGVFDHTFQRQLKWTILDKEGSHGFSVLTAETDLLWHHVRSTLQALNSVGTGPTSHSPAFSRQSACNKSAGSV